MPSVYNKNDNNGNENKTLININEQVRVKVRNDLIYAGFNVESKVYESSSKSYDSIIKTVNDINKLLKEDEKSNNVRNIQIYFSNTPVYSYTPQENKLIGYKTVANIAFEFLIKEESDIKKMVSLQNKIMHFSQNNVNILIDRMRYSLTTNRQKNAELRAIRKAINLAKLKASAVIETIGISSYFIKEMTVNTTLANMEPLFRGPQALSAVAKSEGGNNDIISEGYSDVIATIDMKITV